MATSSTNGTQGGARIRRSDLQLYGRLLVRNGSVETYCLGGRVYQARYRSLGGWIGTGGWDVEEVARP